MTATTKDRGGDGMAHYTYELTPSPLMKGATIIPNNVLCNFDAGGLLVNAADTAGHSPAGISCARGDTTGIADSVTRLRARRGVVKVATSGASACTIANNGKMTYVLDNQTVVLAAGTVNTIKAGRQIGIDGNDGMIYVDTNDLA